MIHHISIAVSNPLHVAQVLAELWQGEVAPFPAHEGSYMVLPLDVHGTLIELLPRGTELVPGRENEATQFENNLNPSAYTATHAAISVPVSEEEIRAIAQRESWRVVRCDREGYFEVIELWVENHLLIELLPPAIAPRYLSFMHPQALKSFLTNMAIANEKSA
ncbi:MAG: hypothetical protein HC840_15025 [Leptolyngbyaceae cyanobacterium RM2_2_4]|nr:hypothetical protein [Leptolyngbyaceae cyanobacterium SM1_4_3]NJN90242.1 hypothetical protein [Leptolyngbyaceae cyanobacterium SL_5_14]NJO50531.1 hypothetical protein [Leptolyngbyaceae cyanobacterium RM2_2_4]